ncbi:MAG: EVE domain-containing protein [Leifsonia flava]
MAIRYWLAVASRDHVRTAVDLGIAQVNRGARAGLDRMGEFDGLVYYSPKTEYPDGEILRHFTAVGRVADGLLYQAVSMDRNPWRRRVDWDLAAESAPIRPLLGSLDLTRNAPDWGHQLRAGFLEISRHDFEIIRQAMQRPSPDDRRYPEERRWPA